MVDDRKVNGTRTYGRQPQGPNPALRSLDRLVGTWEKSDPDGTIDGRATFEWMEGGFFLLQHIDFTETKGIEVIGYDEESGSIRSHYFGNGGGILEYTYELEGDTLTVSIDMPRAKGRFVGTFSEVGNSCTGRWEWTQDREEMAYDAILTKVEER
jgi:hypothetical protein